MKISAIFFIATGKLTESRVLEAKLVVKNLNVLTLILTSI